MIFAYGRAFCFECDEPEPEPDPDSDSEPDSDSDPSPAPADDQEDQSSGQDSRTIPATGDPLSFSFAMLLSIAGLALVALKHAQREIS